MGSTRHVSRLTWVRVAAASVLLTWGLGCATPPPSASDAGAMPAGADERRDAIGVLKVDRDTLDLGTLPPNRRVEANLGVRNSGRAPLSFEVKTSCGCTVAEPKRRTLAPGETATVVVAYQAGAAPGRFDKKVWLITDKPGKPDRVAVSVRGEVLRLIEPAPAEVAFELRGDATVEAVVSLVGRRSDTPFAVVGYTATGDAVRVAWDRQRRATQHALRLSASADKLQAAPRGVISVQVDHPEVDAVTVNYRVQAAFETRPARVFVSNLEPGKPVTRTVSVVSHYGAPFKIAAVRTVHGLVEVTPPTPNKYGYRLDVTMHTPTGPDAARVIKDYVMIDIEGHPEPLQVYCYGRVSPQTP